MALGCSTQNFFNTSQDSRALQLVLYKSSGTNVNPSLALALRIQRIGTIFFLTSALKAHHFHTAHTGN